jgi:hypothetical protein
MISLTIYVNKSPIHPDETVPLEFGKNCLMHQWTIHKVCHVLTGANPFFFSAGLARG